MGTRGSYGFRIDETDKLTYNHFDSYPSELGNNIVTFVKETSDEELQQIAERLVLVNESATPTPEQIESCKAYFNGSVSNQTENDWYCLLRDAQGQPKEYKKGLSVMLDGNTFVLDSLFCEYAYIINVDKGVLEFYKGFNHNPEAEGRYASLNRQEPFHGDAYYGIELLYEFDFEDIRIRDVDEILKEMDTLCREEDEEE